MKPSSARHRYHASAARMFVLFFGVLVLAGLLLLGMATVLKSVNAPSKKPAPAPASTAGK